MKRYIMTLGLKDIGKKLVIGPFGERIHVAAFMGPVQPQDTGKQIYDVGNGVYQVESCEQLTSRLTKL